METWEHIVVMAVTDLGDVEHLVRIEADGTQTNLGNDSSLAAILVALNHLGTQGWQVVSVNEMVTSDSGTFKYFLKRRTS